MIPLRVSVTLAVMMYGWYGRECRLRSRRGAIVRSICHEKETL